MSEGRGRGIKGALNRMTDRQNLKECIPVGCKPAAHWPFMGGVPGLWGKYLVFWGCTWSLGGVPGLGGCVPRWGVLLGVLPVGGVLLVGGVLPGVLLGGGYLLLGGGLWAPGWGVVCSWVGACVLLGRGVVCSWGCAHRCGGVPGHGGVPGPGGCTWSHTTPPWTESQIPVKNITLAQLRCGR